MTIFDAGIVDMGISDLFFNPEGINSSRVGATLYIGSLI